MNEPVAWMVYTEDGKSVYVTDNPTDITDGQRALPLYTKPPFQVSKDAALKLALAFIERVNREGWILADFEQEMYAAIAAIKEAILKRETHD